MASNINDLYSYLSDLIKSRNGAPQQSRMGDSSSGPTLILGHTAPPAPSQLPEPQPIPQTNVNKGLSSVVSTNAPTAPGPDILSSSMKDGMDMDAINKIVSQDATGLEPMLKKYWPLLVSTLGAIYNRRNQQMPRTAPLPASMTDHLRVGNYTRPSQEYQGDYYTYGQIPEHSFFENNEIPRFARGGISNLNVGLSRTPQYVTSNGSNGRADDVNAKLSSNEYVMDAETMALLGDGNPDAGAKKMDKLRANIRKHKGKKLAEGKISPNSHDDVEDYMGGSL